MPEISKLILLCLVIAAGISDVRSRRIPNWMTVPAAIAGIALNSALVPKGWMVALMGMGLALLVYLPLFVVRGMGGGDVKLMAAIGALAGPANWFVIFLATAIVAGATSLVVVSIRRRVLDTARNLGMIATALLHRQRPADLHPELDVKSSRSLRMPHGAFIATGSMVFLILARMA